MTQETTLSKEEQDAIMDRVAEESIAAILSETHKSVDMEVTRKWLELVYSFYDLKAPERVEVVDSPAAAFALEEKLTGSTKRQLDRCCAQSAGWVAKYDAVVQLGWLPADDKDVKNVYVLRDFIRTAWDTILLDECAIVVAAPAVFTDSDGNLHKADGPAVLWRDGNKEWAWHGVITTERSIMSPKSYSREEYEAIADTEQRRVIGEAAGWDHVMALLGAKTLDAWTDANTGLSYELLGTDTQRWLKKQSPALQNDVQPVYVEPVHEGLRTAQAARKWQATDWEPEACERDPLLTYGQET